MAISAEIQYRKETGQLNKNRPTLGLFDATVIRRPCNYTSDTKVRTSIR